MHKEYNHKDNRGKRGNQLTAKTVQLVIEIPEDIVDHFQDAVERNGKSAKDVLKLYMQKYIWKQSELQRNRQKRRQNIG
jgi:hypothetical protein